MSRIGKLGLVGVRFPLMCRVFGVLSRIIGVYGFLVLIIGCNTPIYRRPAPVYRPPASQPVSKTEPTGNVRLNITDFRVNKTNNKQVNISGKIANCSYEMKEYQIGTRIKDGAIRREPCQVCNSRRSQIPRGCAHCNFTRYKTTRERISYKAETKKRTWWENFSPSRLSITADHFGTTEVDVSADGSFQGVTQVDKNYFVDRSQAEALTDKYWKLQVKPSPIFKVSVSVTGNRELQTTCKSDIGLFTVVPNYDACQEYTKRLVTNVQLSVKEKITRITVTPTITVTGIRVPTKESLRAQLTKEFSSGRLASRAINNWFPKYIGTDETMTKTTQSITFDALVGGSYKIQTVHGKYYYFSGVLTPMSWPNTRKDILLIEKGEKVREEQVKEGEGGEIVDPR